MRARKMQNANARSTRRSFWHLYTGTFAFPDSAEAQMRSVAHRLCEEVPAAAHRPCELRLRKQAVFFQHG
jgi:hypothetical protein